MAWRPGRCTLSVSESCAASPPPTAPKPQPLRRCKLTSPERGRGGGLFLPVSGNGATSAPERSIADPGVRTCSSTSQSWPPRSPQEHSHRRSAPASAPASAPDSAPVSAPASAAPRTLPAAPSPPPPPPHSPVHVQRLLLSESPLPLPLPASSLILSRVFSRHSKERRAQRPKKGLDSSSSSSSSQSLSESSESSSNQRFRRGPAPPPPPPPPLPLPPALAPSVLSLPPAPVLLRSSRSCPFVGLGNAALSRPYSPNEKRDEKTQRVEGVGGVGGGWEEHGRVTQDAICA